MCGWMYMCRYTENGGEKTRLDGNMGYSTMTKLFLYTYTNCQVLCVDVYVYVHTENGGEKTPAVPHQIKVMYV